MRILLLSLADLTSSTADSITTLKTGRALAAAGHEVTIAAPRQEGGRVALDPGGARVRFHGNVRRLGLPNSINSLVQLLRLGALQRPGRADVVYVRAASLTFAIGAWCRLTGGPVVVSEHHGWAAAERGMHGRHTWAAPLERMLQVWDARCARRVRTVVPGIRERLERHGVPPGRVVVIGNACDTDRIVPVERGAALAALGFDARCLYLGFLGSLTRWQGLERVLDAFARGTHGRSELRLLIAGDGPLRGELEAQAAALGIEGRVRFLGRVDHAEVPALLGCFDVALLPTALGGYTEIGRAPLKLREYAAAGRLVLAARVPGLEDLAGEPWLHLYDAADDDGLAAAIDRLTVAPPETLAEHGARARRYAERHFAWPVVIERVIAELGLDELCRGARRRAA